MIRWTYPGSVASGGQTPISWERYLEFLKMLHALSRPRASQFQRDGSHPIATGLDRPRRLYCATVRTTNPRDDIYAPTGSPVPGLLGIDRAGVLRRIRCEDGESETTVFLRVWRENTAGVQVGADLVNAAGTGGAVASGNPPVDITNLNGAVTAGEVLRVAVVTGANVTQALVYVVDVEMALDFRPGA